MTDNHDLEKGFEERPAHGEPSTDMPSRNESLHGSKTDLEVFQTLAGIHFLAYGGGALKNRQKPPASVLQDIFMPSKAAAARFRNRDRTCMSVLIALFVFAAFVTSESTPRSTFNRFLSLSFMAVLRSDRSLSRSGGADTVESDGVA